MTSNTPNTFKFQPDYQIGQQVWHRADRDMSGMIDSIILYGREEFRYRVSWGNTECTEERETTLTDERPSEFEVGGESGDN